jgi:hypothetical protein
MPKITTGTVLLLTRKALMLAPGVSTGVAVGASTRSTCGLAVASGWVGPGVRVGGLGFRCSSSGPSK